MSWLHDLFSHAVAQGASAVTLESGEAPRLRSDEAETVVGSPIGGDVLNDAISAELDEQRLVDLMVGNIVDFELHSAGHKWRVLIEPRAEGLRVRALRSDANRRSTSTRPRVQADPVEVPHSAASSAASWSSSAAILLDDAPLPDATHDAFDVDFAMGPSSGTSSSGTPAAEGSGGVPRPFSGDPFSGAYALGDSAGPGLDAPPPGTPTEDAFAYADSSALDGFGQALLGTDDGAAGSGGGGTDPGQTAREPIVRDDDDAAAPAAAAPEGVALPDPGVDHASAAAPRPAVAPDPLRAQEPAWASRPTIFERAAQSPPIADVGSGEATGAFRRADESTARELTAVEDGSSGAWAFAPAGRVNSASTASSQLVGGTLVLARCLPTLELFERHDPLCVLDDDDPRALASSMASRAPGSFVVLVVDDLPRWLDWVLRRLEEGHRVIVDSRATTPAGALWGLLGTACGPRAEAWLSRHQVLSWGPEGGLAGGGREDPAIEIAALGWRAPAELGH